MGARRVEGGRQLSVLLSVHLASFNTPTSRGRLVVKGSWDLIISGN